MGYIVTEITVRIIKIESSGKMEKEKQTVKKEKKETAACPACAPKEEKGCCRTKERSEKEYKDLIHRLNRVEGQIRGIKGMLEKDAYCIDILNQVSAANCALNSFTKELLANHIRSCVADDVRDGRDEKLNELVCTLQKLMK